MNPKEAVKLVDVMWAIITPPKEYHAFYPRKDSRVVFTFKFEKNEDKKIVGMVFKFVEKDLSIGEDRTDYVDELFATAERSILSLGR